MNAIRTGRALGVFLCFAMGLPAADSGSAMAAYKIGDYKTAIPLLQAACQGSPKDASAAAALLSALVYEGRIDQAADAAEADATAFPDSPEVIAARGELAFYMSDMREAERLFKAAFKLKEATPRAIYGLSRIYRMASMYRSARLLCLRAHEIDPDDALIMSDWLRYLVPEKRNELLGPFMQAHPWFFKRMAQYEQTTTELKDELKEHKEFQLEGERKETTLNFTYLQDGPQRVRGVGLEVAIERGKRLRMLFDTGASGILVTQAAIDRAGLKHVGSWEAGGIGDKGPRSTFFAVAKDCTIGTLKYTNCAFEATEGKGRIAGDEDGLIGADFFSDYILLIDFQKRLLHLTPQPSRPPNPQGYDRTVPQDEAGFTPVFRSGGHLFVYTRVNNKSAGLFLLDTGSSFSNIDSTFARLSTKVHGDEYVRVRGVSGQVKDVFEADKAELEFGRFRQRNIGLTAFNLNNAPDHQEFRMAGILGIPVLSLFRLTIDYRNGLVNFDYILDKH
ncbi:MAG: aspartyl protease family protein [Acidobacteriaceae bacterium]|nr:aspartyl protease family protein [Acidobacteriaceae bacterium]